MPDHYKRYLINSLRESFDLPGTPMRLTVKSGSNPFVDGSGGPARPKGDAKTAPRRVTKAQKAEEAKGLPGKAPAKKAAAAKPTVVKAKLRAASKAKAATIPGKRARTGARQVSRSGRIRTGGPSKPKR